MGEAASASMRLDRFLWWARLAKTRSVAQGLAECGSFRVNGRRIERAAAAVRIGDTLTFAGPNGRVRALRVLALPHRRGPAPEAQGCYAELAGAGAANAVPDVAPDAAPGAAPGTANVSQVTPGN